MSLTKMKSMVVGLAAMIGVSLAPQAAAVVLNGTLHNSGIATVGTIDFWSFTQNSAGNTSFDILSWGAYPTYADIEIWLFSGSATPANLVAMNDDSGGTFSDGSTSGLDAFLLEALPAGNYVLAVGTCCTTVNDITDDFQQQITAYFDAGGLSATTAAQYQLTILGDVDLNGVAVPEPATLALLGLGLAGLGFSRRKQ